MVREDEGRVRGLNPKPTASFREEKGRKGWETQREKARPREAKGPKATPRIPPPNLAIEPSTPDWQLYDVLGKAWGKE